MKTSNDPKQLRGCGVYIFNDAGDRVLLTQRGPAARHERFKWEGPGGQVDDGETYEDACHREIREELGVDVVLGDLIWQYDAVFDSNGDSWAAKIYRGSITETPSLPEPEKVSGFAWFTREDVQVLHAGGLLADYAVKDFEQLGWL
jgi:8-oxo-dGTP pyrophosphatase MutT (NUDIX family)